MVDDAKNQLTLEYIKKLKWYMPIVKIGAFNRFDMKDGQFISITRSSQFYAVIAIILVSITGYTIILETAVNDDVLLLPEYITVIELGVLNHLVLLNIHLFNKHSGAEMLKHCIELDLFLGAKQTKFMRDISTKDVLIWSGCIATFELVLVPILIVTFDVPVYTYITGAVYFQFLFSLCYDEVLQIVFYKFLCLRIHYLNVGLVKMANLNTEYLAEQLLSYPYLWKKEYDEYVKIPKPDGKYFTGALRMIAAQVRRFQYGYRFMIFLCMASLVIGTFLAVQLIIIFIKTDIPAIRTFSLTGWFVVSWSIFIVITQQTDKINVQIQCTKLICTYIQLNPSHSDELFHLSRSILDTLSATDFRISIYDLFSFNQSLIRSITTSVFVYITMQLQLAFPKRSNANKINTNT